VCVWVFICVNKTKQHTEKQKIAKLSAQCVCVCVCVCVYVCVCVCMCVCHSFIVWLTVVRYFSVDNFGRKNTFVSKCANPKRTVCVCVCVSVCVLEVPSAAAVININE